LSHVHILERLITIREIGAFIDKTSFLHADKWEASAQDFGGSFGLGWTDVVGLR
jgi:hypothetical protein